jgi:DNA gyrase/topoisomerase IV subunit A
VKKERQWQDGTMVSDPAAARRHVEAIMPSFKRNLLRDVGK